MTRQEFIDKAVSYGFCAHGIAGKWLIHGRHPRQFFEYDSTNYDNGFRMIMKKLRQLDRR